MADDLKRRVKILWITSEALWALFTSWAASLNFYRVRLTNVPADAQVGDVAYSFERQAFMMKVRHPSFPEVRDGDEIPHVDALEWECLLPDPTCPKCGLDLPAWHRSFEGQNRLVRIADMQAPVIVEGK